MPQPMQDDIFWSIIDRITQAGDDSDDRLQALKQTLSGLSLDDIISFEMTFRHLLNNAYTWDLWGAAYVIHRSCGDDGFEYFRRWLVSRGREAYEAALSDPDSLADLALLPTGPEGCWEFEELYYIAMEVFEERGGEGDVRDYSAPEAGCDGHGPSGDKFREDADHLKARYPKLWQRFESAPLG